MKFCSIIDGLCPLKTNKKSCDGCKLMETYLDFREKSIALKSCYGNFDTCSECPYFSIETIGKSGGKFGSCTKKYKTTKFYGSSKPCKRYLRTIKCEVVDE